MKLKKITAIAAALSVATTAGLCAIGCGKDSATPTNPYEYDIPQDYSWSAVLPTATATV